MNATMNATMKKNAAFTLIELMIVVAIITVSTGYIAKTWSAMEKMSAAVHRNMLFTFQSRNILDRMSEDIRNSIQVSRSEGSLLHLTQLAESGEKLQIYYIVEGKELIRDRLKDGVVSQSVKVASLNDRFLEVSFLNDGMIRIEIRRRPKESPLEMKNHSLTAYVCMPGELR